MSQAGRAFTVARAHGFTFRSPVEDNGRSGQRKRTNYLIRLDIDGPDGPFMAIGEAQPRSADTGDEGPSWSYLLACLSELQGASLDVADRRSALDGIRSVMARFHEAGAAFRASRAIGPTSLRRTARDLAKKAARRAGRLDPVRPFRGTLMGVEAALLDAAARVLNCSVAELLGEQQSTVSPLNRLRGSKDLEENLQLLRDASSESPNGMPLWLDLRSGLDPVAAQHLVQEVAEAASRGEITAPVFLEQPVGLRHRDRLTALQRQANAASTGHELRIMAGGRSAWGAPGLRRLVHKGSLGAINIRPAAAGGLLAALDLADTVKELAPQMTLLLSNVEGAGEVGARQLSNLASAMTKADFLISGNGTSGEHESQAPGFGIGMPYASMLDTITKHEAFPPVPEPETPGPQPNTYDEVTYLQPLGPNGTKGHLLERQALSLGLSTTRFSKGAFTATDGVHDPLLIKWSRSPLSSAVSLALCTHKEATRIRLRRAGVPVPRGRTFVNGDFDSGRAFAERIGYPVVVKPAMGVRGIGVVANIQNEQELDRAFAQFSDSKLGDQDFIVEKHINGGDYRIVVVGDEVVAAILREPASVVGDGERSIAELMIHKNLRRRLNPHLWGRPIMYDEAARYQLQREDMTLESVPDKGRQVMLSNSSSLSQGGDSFDILDELHPEIKEAALQSVKAIPGLAFCGVDFLIEDHTKPLEGQQAGICELNAHAAIGNCEYPLYGQPRGVARAFMDECVERYGLITHQERAKTLALKLTIRGRVAGVGYRAWMRRQATTFGVRGWVQNAGNRTVEAVLVGDTEPVSALAAAAVLGPRKALPTSVSTTHVVPPEVSGQFQVVRKAPKEVAHVA